MDVIQKMEIHNGIVEIDLASLAFLRLVSYYVGKLHVTTYIL